MTSKTKGKDLEAFRALHDKSYLVPKRITDGLAELGESWEYEAEFIRRCQLSTTDFANYRDPFLDFAIETGSSGGNRGKRVWCGTKKFAAQLREKVK
jgi:hypothetical protein